MANEWKIRKAARWLVILLLCLVAVVGLLWREQRVSSAANISLDVSFSHAPGSYSEDIALALETPNPQAQIYFTLDGSLPDTQSSPTYEGPISLSAESPQVVVIRAQAVLPDGSSGPVNSGSFIMSLDSELPVLSIIADPGDLWDEERGIYVNHGERGREWERPVDLTYVTGESEQGFHLGSGLRIHGEWTRWFFDKKSLRLYFREEYGARKLLFPLFGEDGQIAFDHLYLHNSDQDLLLFRNQLTERLYTQMGGFAVRGHPVLLFINGRPWGIYNIRERIDERFLEQTYGVPYAAIADTPNIPSRQTAEQRATDLMHWENVMEFVQENDLSDPDNYTFLGTQVDLANFIDYYLLQMYIANTDWPHHNVHQFRPRTPGGRWEWIVWDNDLAFERVDRQMVDHVLTVEHPLGKRMELFLNKLLANPDFYNLFLTRAADLLNTTLSAQNVTAEVDSFLAYLEADVPLEQARWNVPDNWDDVKAIIRTFAADRTAIMRQHFVESFDLAGTAIIRVASDGAPQGWIRVNDLDPQLLPWQGEHFIGTELSLRAIPPAGFAFERWEGYSGPSDPTSAEIIFPVTMNTNLTARFMALDESVPHQQDVIISTYQVDGAGGIDGDWFELQVRRPGGVDLRGWRITDNDSIISTDEGSLVLSDDPLLTGLPMGSAIRIITTISNKNDALFPEDRWQDDVLILYAGNGRINTTADPWFNLGPKDNLLLLAPGSGEEFADDIPIDLWSENKFIRSADFGLPPKSTN